MDVWAYFKEKDDKDNSGAAIALASTLKLQLLKLKKFHEAGSSSRRDLGEGKKRSWRTYSLCSIQAAMKSYSVVYPKYFFGQATKNSWKSNIYKKRNLGDAPVLSKMKGQVFGLQLC